MTVIAFDGRYVAADKQATRYNTRYTTLKLHVHEGAVLAYCGDEAMGLSLVAWWRGGCKLEDWPQRDVKPKDDQATNFYVFRKGMPPLEFGVLPIPIPMLDTMFASGSGGDFAWGAMLAGASAEEAVKIASQRDNGCGMGVDVVDLWSLGDAASEAGLQRPVPASGGPDDAASQRVDLRQGGG